MAGPWRILGLVFAIIAYVVVLGGLILSLRLGGAGMLLLFAVAAVYAWMLFAFLHYRHARQEEFQQVLAAAAEAEAPLAPALWAYLHDRPHGTLREVGVAVLLCFVFPGYYWIWHRRAAYDRKVARVAELLEDGYPLSEALAMTPGVASRETLLAVTLGEHTGRLALSLRLLRGTARGRLATLWLEVVPRLAYPLFLLVMVSSILTFYMLYLLPKFEKIFRDFSMALPEETERAVVVGSLAGHFSWILALAVPAFAGLVVVLVVNPSFRWYFPVVGRLYAGYLRSQILQALAFLLQAGRPAPEALRTLAENEALVEGARARLAAVCARVERGEPLADSLHRGKLLPRAMVPLLRTAERAGNLPWALGELADLLAQRSARRVQRLSLILFPIPIIGVGLLVGVVVLGIYMPLITLIDGLAQ